MVREPWAFRARAPSSWPLPRTLTSLSPHTSSSAPSWSGSCLDAAIRGGSLRTSLHLLNQYISTLFRIRFRIQCLLLGLLGNSEIALSEDYLTCIVGADLDILESSEVSLEVNDILLEISHNFCGLDRFSRFHRVFPLHLAHLLTILQEPSSELIVKKLTVSTLLGYGDIFFLLLAEVYLILAEV